MAPKTSSGWIGVRTASGFRCSRHAWLSGFTALALALVACGSDDDDAPSDAGAQTVVDVLIDPSAGGKVSLESGPSLNFPAGALPMGSFVVIRVALSDSDVGPSGVASPVWEFGPAGTTFSTPVAIALPFELGDKDPKDYTIAWTKLGSDEYEDVATTFEAGKALAMVSHFSHGCIRMKSPPAEPKPVTCDDETFTARDTNDDGIADKCECKTGFKAQDAQCVDIDECEDNHGGCSADVDCNNTPGSFTCGSCGEGFTGGGKDGCTDIDECKTNNGDCGAHKLCDNTAGGHECGACETGFKAKGAECVDVDECATDNGGCGAHKVCTNKAGSRECGGCVSGYEADGSQCVDVDECGTNNGGCGANKLCTNTAGGRECGGCKTGYTPQASECVDVNECATNNGGCGENKLCTNTVGAHTCGDSCVTGYKLQEAESGSTCVDLDECTEGPSPCQLGELCTNQVGSRICGEQCPEGYAAIESVCKRTGNLMLDFAIATKQDATGSDFIHAPNVASSTDIELTLPAGTNLEQLWVALSTSEGSHVSTATTGPESQSVPGEGGPIDFSSGELIYTVTAEDGGTRVYHVRVHLKEANELAAISINDYWGTIRANLITVAIPENAVGFNFTLTPKFVLAEGATVSPVGPVSFENGVAEDFTVSREGSPSTTYHVTVNVGTELSSAKDFETFTLPDQLSSEVTTATATVAVVMPPDSVLSTVTPTFSVSENATVWPSSGTVMSFEGAQTFFIIAQDGTVKTYQVTASVGAGTGTE